MKYKRYMVFTWDEYDNSSPFECVDSSFDYLLEAKSREQELKNEAELACVFDRIDGVKV